jgi:hypothetical protein
VGERACYIPTQESHAYYPKDEERNVDEEIDPW